MTPQMTRTDIRVVWDDIKDEVAACIGGERPEDVYAACVYNRATLYTCPEGFVVLQIMDHPATHDPELYIWVGSGKGTGLFKKYEPFFIEQARNHGCATVSFSSNRRGFEKLAGPEWSTRCVIYERKV